MEDKEIRTFQVQELRADILDGESNPKIRGYAAVFDQLSEDLGGFREQIARGAFTRAILEDDVRALFNHDSNYVLGRTKNGTLSLKEDIHGLRIEINPPDAQWARDLMSSIQRGDIDQMSFAFQTTNDKWEFLDGVPLRTVQDVKLFDVSPVTYPAYPQTSVSVRDMAHQITQAREDEDTQVLEHLRAVRTENRKKLQKIFEIGDK